MWSPHQSISYAAAKVQQPILFCNILALPGFPFNFGPMKHDVTDWIPLAPETQAQMAACADGALLAVRQKKAGKVLLAKYQGTWHALRNRCPHQGFALTGGRVTGEGAIECPVHKFRFGLVNGREPSGTCGAVKIFPLREVNGQHEIGIKQSKWKFLRS